MTQYIYTKPIDFRVYDVSPELDELQIVGVYHEDKLRGYISQNKITGDLRWSVYKDGTGLDFPNSKEAARVLISLLLLDDWWLEPSGGGGLENWEVTDGSTWGYIRIIPVSAGSSVIYIHEVSEFSDFSIVYQYDSFYKAIWRLAALSGHDVPNVFNYGTSSL